MAARTQPTSLLRISSRGFTLLEVMVVVGIVAALAVAAVSRLGSGRNNETKTFLRHLTTLSRELHTKAKLKGAAYRIVLDLKDGGESKLDSDIQSYWVERSDSGSLMSKDEEEEMAKAEADAFRDKEKPLPNKGFSRDTDVMKEPRTLPYGMVISQVELTRASKPIATGKAYIHFLPEGLVDEAAIHIKDERDRKWTIAIHPLTGKAELITKALSLKEIKSQ